MRSRVTFFLIQKPSWSSPLSTDVVYLVCMTWINLPKYSLLYLNRHFLSCPNHCRLLSHPILYNHAQTDATYFSAVSRIEKNVPQECIGIHHLKPVENSAENNESVFLKLMIKLYAILSFFRSVLQHLSIQHIQPKRCIAVDAD